MAFAIIGVAPHFTDRVALFHPTIRLELLYSIGVIESAVRLRS